MRNWAAFLFLLFIFSCAKEQIDECVNCEFNCVEEGATDVITNSCLDNYECSFKVFSNAKVDTEEFDGVSEGNKMVFQMINSTDGDERIADDEFTNYFVFELPEDQNTFSVTADEISKLNAYFKTVCFCADVRFNAPSAGCMQGEKQADGTWFIQSNLVFEWSYGECTLKLDARFTPE